MGRKAANLLQVKIRMPSWGDTLSKSAPDAHGGQKQREPKCGSSYPLLLDRLCEGGKAG